MSKAYSYGPFARNARIAAIKLNRSVCILPHDMRIFFTVVSGFKGRLSCRGVPPSLMILAFFLCSRRSWFFFMRAISSSSLMTSQKGQQTCKEDLDCDDLAYLFLARLSLSASPVGAKLSAMVCSSSRSCRPRMYARMTAGSRMISVCHSPSI